MVDVADDLEILLTDVRKTISDNALFLGKLVDETIEDESEDELNSVAAKEDFEEL